MNKYAIEELEPKRVWEIFHEICQIPRPSKNEAKITEFVKNFGEKLQLETIVEDIGNVIIKKPATKGNETKKTVAFQGHLDMVPQKTKGTIHDFTKDPIKAYIDGDWVSAEGTTLGADNGIGLSMALAVLEATDIEHGPIEAIFTVDEETGLSGAAALSDKNLNADILLNLDSEEEDFFYIGCAGGMDTNITMNYPETASSPNNKSFVISISGLYGGHSGADIHLNRGNATKILTQILTKIREEIAIEIAAISGGSLRNAIPREAHATVTIAPEKISLCEKIISEETKLVKESLGENANDMVVHFDETTNPEKIITNEFAEKILQALTNAPHGVIAMSQDIPGLVDTSTNFAVIRIAEGNLEINTSQRSSVDTEKFKIAEMLKNIFEPLGAKVFSDSEYPGWKPNPNTEIIKTIKRLYAKMQKSEPEFLAIHAGLECGLISGKYPNMEMISFGPTIKNAHSPDEKVEILSVKRVWEFIIELLKEIPEK